MNRYSHVSLSLIIVALLSCGALYRAVPLAWAEEAPPAPAASAVLSMDGPGGRVSLGGTLAQAKKAFPARKGARVQDVGNFVKFQRDAWCWYTKKPAETFEVSLAEGKVVDIMRTVVMSSERSRKKLIAQTIEKVGKPTAQSKGKSVAVYAWDIKPNARFLVEYIQGPLVNGSVLISAIGSQSDLAKFDMKADDVNGMVARWDAGVEYVKNQQKRRTKPGKRSR